jgi:hypothetical protein
MEPFRNRSIAAIVLAHFALIACYTFPRAWVPDRLHYWSITYARPLFHQGWDLFAPDPPRCSCEIQAGLNDQDWRALDASQDHYLATRMVRNIAAYLNGGSPFPDTLRVDPLMERAMRGMVRDIGREVKNLRFRAVQQCVADDRRPLDRSIRYVPIAFIERTGP